MFVGILLAVSVASAAPAVPPAPHYTVTDLGTLGGAYSMAMALNNKGQVVGGSSLVAHSLSVVLHTHAFLWDGAHLQDIGMLPGFPYAVAHGVNNAGQVVGGSDISTNRGGVLDFKMVSHAFFWEAGRRVDLSAGSSTFSAAYGINDTGQVVGEADARAVLWQNGHAELLGDLGGKVSSAKAINSGGQIVGDSMPPGGVGPHAFFRNGEGMKDLGTLGGAASQAYGINNNGQVVGWANIATGDRHAFLWQDGKLQDLSTLGGSRSAAFGINDAGQVVGSSSVLTDGMETEADHACLWLNGRKLDLNSVVPAGSGWALQEATAINDTGQITGSGEIDGFEHAFLLNPQPADVE
ncbi:MAG: HAF repeat-containing protein [Armatimonadota bacterium]|nr:HAF repeat-containing protein [Armatimonadota bacterium]